MNTTKPGITPRTQPEQNEVLTGTAGGWANEPTSFSYQWLRCNGAGAECSNIAGATGTTYTVAAADFGHALALQVTAKNAAGEASAVSAATQAALEVKQPQLSPAPTEKAPNSFTGTSGTAQFADGGNSWSCSSGSISGAFVNATEAKNVRITVSGCSGGLGTKTSEPLRGTLGYVSEANHTAALKLAPETGNIWVPNWWATGPLEGSLIGAIGPVNAEKSTHFTLGYHNDKGVQELRRFERPLNQANQNLTWDKGEMVVSAEFKITTNGPMTIKG